MIRKGQFSVAAKIVLAVVVLFSTSGMTLLGRCSPNVCGRACAMHGQTAKTSEPLCCAHKSKQENANKEPAGKCRCEIRSCPTVAQVSAKILLSPAPLLDFGFISEKLTLPTLIVKSSEAPFYSGSSPGIVFRSPARGRAPPAA